MKQLFSLRGHALLATFGLVWASCVAASAAQTELKLLSSWPENQPVPNFAISMFIEEVEKASNGTVSITRYGPEVVPAFEQLEPASSGTFDLLFTHPAYHSGATAIGSLIDTVGADQDLRHSSGVFDWFDSYYQKNFNVKLLAAPTQTGYQFLLKEPLNGDEGLKGRKIRSNSSYDPIVTKLGGAPVSLPTTQIYSGLQKSLVDGSAYIVTTPAKQKMYEVVQYMARPTFGVGNQFLMINLDKWNTLDPVAQKALMQASQKIEAAVPWFTQKLELEDAEQMIINGARYTYFDPENAANLSSYYNNGLWEQAVARNGADAEEIISLIKKTGMEGR